MIIPSQIKNIVLGALVLLGCTVFVRPATAKVNKSAARESYLRGNEYLNIEDIPGALVEFDKALEYDPENVDALFKLGYVYTYRTKVKYYDRAPEYFLKVIDLIADSTSYMYLDSYFHLGVVYMRIGDYVKAVAAFNEVMMLSSDHKIIDVHNHLGVVYYYMDRYQEAIREFKTALQMDANHKMANFNLKSVNMRLEHYNLGVTYFFMKNFDEAVKEFNKALEIDNNFYAAHYELGVVYLQMGRRRDAIKAFDRALRINPDHPQSYKIYNQLGVVYYLQNQRDKSIESLRLSLKLDHTYMDSIINLRNVYNDYDPLAKVKIDKVKHKAKYIAMAKVYGNDYMMIAEYEKAVKIFREILDLDYQDTDSYTNIVLAYSKQAETHMNHDRWQNAINMLEKLVTIDPTNLEALYNLGICYYKKGPIWSKEAIGALQRAAKYKGSQYYLGLVYAKSRQAKKALIALENAKVEDSENADIYFQIGVIYYKGRDFESALDNFKLAVSKAIQPKLKGSAASWIKKTERKIQISVDDDDDYDLGGSDVPEIEVEDDEIYAPQYSGSGGGRGRSSQRRPVTPAEKNNSAIRLAKSRDYFGALELLREALERLPESAALYSNIAGCLLGQKNYPEAELQLSIARALNSSNSRIALNLAILYYAKGEMTNVRREFENAVAIDPSLASRWSILLTTRADIGVKDIHWIRMQE